MNNQSLLRYLHTILFALVLTSPVYISGQTAHETEPGFERIFNGKDLSGWDGDSLYWSVEDGVIRGETTEKDSPDQNTFLLWEEERLDDFELRLKFRIQNGNSGVQYRSVHLGNHSVAGYQAEIENTPGKVGFLYHERGRGWLVNVGDFVVVEPNGSNNVVSNVWNVDELIDKGYYNMKEWNEYRIVARGNHIIHYLNGYQTVELIDRDVKNRLKEGILALQIHTGPPMVVEFKDIRLKQFEDDYGQAIRLFNGENMEDWAGYPEEQKEAWQVIEADVGAEEDIGGVLHTNGKPRGFIRTERQYTNYVLRMQIRHVTKGNTGILLRASGEDQVWPMSVEAQGEKGNLGDIWNIGQYPMEVNQSRTSGRRTQKIHPSNERPVGEWNEYEIYLNEGLLRIFVNDLLQNSATEVLARAGHICLQSEGAQVDFRNIVLIPIE